MAQSQAPYLPPTPMLSGNCSLVQPSPGVSSPLCREQLQTGMWLAACPDHLSVHFNPSIPGFSQQPVTVLIVAFIFVVLSSELLS